MNYIKPSLLHYRVAQGVCSVVAALCFRRKVLHNEIRDAEGAYVVIANHQAVLDFVNLIVLTRRPMTFVISNSFFNSLPISGFLTKLGVIPKQQFQTTVSDMKRMKAVVEAGEPLVIYPAGLMCEDGLSTPIPGATYKFLKWLGVDIYAAKVQGTYFSMPKWTSGLRPGRTYLDVYKLISAEELADMDIDTVRKKTDQALSYDAYRDQETLMARYYQCSDIRGLEQVLYVCPHCGSEHTMQIREKSTIFCTACGYAQKSDGYGFLHKVSQMGEQIRYVSDWSRWIYSRLEKQILAGEIESLSCQTRIHMIDYKKHKFLEVGHGCITLNREHFRIRGVINGQQTELVLPVIGLPTLPFSPGKYFEIQDGKNIYRCVLEDGHLVMKFINMVKIFYKLNHPAAEPAYK